MGLGDIIIFFVYLVILNFVFILLRRRYDDPILRKYHKLGFWVKVISCVFFTIFNVYLSPGDSTGLYHKEGYNIYQLILHDSSQIKLLFMNGSDFDETLLKDPWNAGYFRSDSNFLITRMVTVLSFITFGKYMAINLIFSIIAYTGTWKLFVFFYEQRPALHKKIAIAILFLPSFVFWSSGILKDPICIAALGWLSYSLYQLMYKKKAIVQNVFRIIFFAYLLCIIKIYILISYVPVFILFIILKNMEILKNKFLKYGLAPILILLALIVFAKVLNSFNEQLDQYAVKNITKSIQVYNKNFTNQVEGADSKFSLGVEFDGSVIGLVKLTPFAIAATLFRPFIWESRKPSTLIASIESLVMIFFTLYIIRKAGIKNFIKMIFKDPLIMYCFLFSMVFALFVGASTLNFGTLVRYKIPCLPFYLISLYLIYEKVKEQQARKSLAIQADQQMLPSNGLVLCP